MDSEPGFLIALENSEHQDEITEGRRERSKEELLICTPRQIALWWPHQ